MWFFIWVFAAPLSLALGGLAFVLAFRAKTRRLAHALGSIAAIVSVLLLGLFGVAYSSARGAPTDPADLFPPQQRMHAALINGALACGGLTFGGIANWIGLYLARREAR